MKYFTVTFTDEFRGNTEEEVYDELLKYLQECVVNGDITAFDIVEH